jgi:hypothetical protein
MAITEANQPLGFWVFVRDEESAVYASRLCGLPLFLTGLWALLLALLAMIGEQAPVIEELESDRFFGFLLVGGLFVVAGLLIRARFFGLVPVMATLFLVLCAGAILAAGGLIASLREATPGVGVLPTFVSILSSPLFPMLFSLMMISGLRGWWYLRKRGSSAPPHSA